MTQLRDKMNQLEKPDIDPQTLQRAPHQRNLLLLLTLVIAGVIVSFPLFDYDLYWHLANGREMLARGRIVNEEIFSFTRAGTPFSNHEWLAQIVLFAVYHYGGAPGLIGFKLVIALVVAAMLFRTCLFAGARPTLAGLLCIAAILVGMFRYNVRPELFSLLGVASLGLILHGYRAERWHAKALYFIPVIMVLWDWLHGAIFGFALLCIFLTGENVKPWLHRRFGFRNFWQPMSPFRLRALNWTMAATLLAMLLNPYGLLSYDIFFEFVGDNALVRVTEEFAIPTWADYSAFWVALGLLGAVFVARWRKIDLTLLLLALAFSLVAVRYSRATGVFALVCAPIAASLLQITVTGTTRNRNYRTGVNALLIAAAGMTLGHAAHQKFFRPGWTHEFGFGTNEAYLPVGSVRFAQDVNLQGNLYNSGNFGGYLSFFITPQRRIFQYNHHTVFGDTTRFIDRPEELAQWNINYGVVGLPAELDTLFPRAHWARVYREGPAVVVLRRAEENRALIDRYELRYFHPARAHEELRGLARNPEVRPRLLLEIATYLAYRADEVTSALLADLIASPDALPTADRTEIVRLAMRSNSTNDRLARLLR